MVWPIVKLVTQVLTSVVGKSVVEAWKQVSTEVGNKEVFQREVRKAWTRQVDSRLQRKRWRAELHNEPLGEEYMGKSADSNPRIFGEELLRKQFGQMRKENPGRDDAIMMTKKASMPPSEAAKVLHLSEASEAEINKRFELLMTANGSAGASQYLHDKIVHAKDVALSHMKKGTLKRHIKVKKDDAPRPTDTEL